MTIKGFDYLLNENDVHEQFHESLRDATGRPNYLVLCDAVSSADHAGPSRSSQAAATLAEQSLTQYLDQHADEGITEETLQKAFAHANERLLELYGDDRGSVAVSGVVMVLETAEEEGQPDSFLVAGLGDIRVYRIDREHADLVFFDPQTPEIAGALGAEERSLALHNAMGLDAHLRLATRRVMQNPFQRYVLATYGVYSQLGENDLHQLGLHPHDPMSGVTSQLKTLTQTAHTVRICTATYEQMPGAAAALERTMQNATATTTSMPTPESTAEANNGNFNLVLGGAAAALAIGIGMMWMGSSDTESSTPVLADAPIEMPAETTEMLVTDTTETDASLVAALQTERNRADTLEQQLDQARQELREMLRKRGGGDERALERERQERRTLEQQLAQAKQTITEMSARGRQDAADDVETSRDIAQLEASLAKAMQERSELSRELAETRSTLADRQELINATRGPQGQVLERYQNMENQLTQRIDQLVQENSTLRARARDQREELTAQLQTAKAQIHELEQGATTTTAVNTRGEVDLAQEQASAARISELSMQVSETNRDREHLREALHQYQGKVSQLEKIVAAQKAELSTKDPQALATLQTQLMQLSQEHDQALSTIGQLQQRLARSGQREATQRRQSEVAALKQQLTEMEESIAAKGAEASELREQLLSARATEDTLRPQMQHLEARLAEAQQNIAEVELSLTQQQSHTEELKDAYALAVARMKRAEKSTQDMDTLKQAARDLQTERLQLLQDKAALMEKVAALTELDELYQAERALRVQRDKELNTLREQATRAVAQARASAPTTTASDAVAVSEEARSVLTQGEAVPRLHTVRRGDTLSAISVAYYGTAGRADEIYQANREQLPSKNQIRVGSELIIP